MENMGASMENMLHVILKSWPQIRDMGLTIPVPHVDVTSHRGFALSIIETVSIIPGAK